MNNRSLQYNLKTITLFWTLLSLGSVLIIFHPRLYDFVFLVLAFLLSILTKAKISKKIVFITTAIIAVYLLQAWITSTQLVQCVGLILKIIMAMLLLIAFKYDYKDMAKHLHRALSFLMILGVVNFLLVLLVNSWFVTIKIDVVDGNYTTRSLGYLFNTLSVYDFHYFIIPRNQGPFWEPGIFQGLMNLLIYIILIEQRQKISKAIIPSLLVISTFSTTGLILLAILLIIKILRDYTLTKTVVAGLLCSPLILVFSIMMIKNIDEKFHGGGYTSSFSRTFDIFAGIKITKSYPITGIGYNAKKYLDVVAKEKIQIHNRTESLRRGNTNSIALLFCYFGIPLALYLLYKLYNQHLFSQKAFFFIIIFLFIFTVPMIPSYFIILLMLSSIKVNQTKNFPKDHQNI